MYFKSYLIKNWLKESFKYYNVKGYRYISIFQKTLYFGILLNNYYKILTSINVKICKSYLKIFNKNN